MTNLKQCIEVNDLKDMLKKTGEIYGDRPAYKIRIAENNYKVFTHKEVREMIDGLGTALIDLGLKGKRIAVIGENRYEWEIAYLAIVCGTGIVVPLDRSLPENELKKLVERSEIEAIFYSQKYEESLKKIIHSGTGKLKHLISMDSLEHKNGIYSEKELIETGKRLIEQGMDAEKADNYKEVVLKTIKSYAEGGEGAEDIVYTITQTSIYIYTGDPEDRRSIRRKNNKYKRRARIRRRRRNKKYQRWRCRNTMC